MLNLTSDLLNAAELFNEKLEYLRMNHDLTEDELESHIGTVLGNDFAKLYRQWTAGTDRLGNERQNDDE